jgi:uncharacterized protein (TIGR03067 family)
MNRVWQMTMLGLSIGMMAAETSASRAAGADLSASSRRALQGGWTLAYAERDGQALPAAAASNIGLAVRGNRYTIAPGAQPSMAGRFSVNPGTWPRQIDFTPIAGPQAGQTFRGIYSTGGDTHQVSFAPPGQPRPTSFNTTPGSGQVTYVWQRARAATPGRVLTDDALPFQFDW